MTSLTRANSTGSDATFSSEPTRCTAKPTAPSGTAPRVSACTCTAGVPAMMTIPPSPLAHRLPRHDTAL